MPKTKFSPYPWTREGHDILDARRNVVATVHSCVAANDGNPVMLKDAIKAAEADRNAVMIEKAPDLREQLQITSDALRGVIDTLRGDSMEWPDQDAIIAKNDALIKELEDA